MTIQKYEVSKHQYIKVECYSTVIYPAHHFQNVMLADAHVQYLMLAV